MRTLTKERVNLSGLSNNSGALSLDLIGDGPNEVICRKLSKFQKANRQALVLSDQESMVREKQCKRKGYAKMFISRYTKMFGISRENMKDLVGELKDEDVILLEKAVLEKLKKPAIFQVVGSFSAIAIFFGSILETFLFGNQIYSVLIPLMGFTTTGWLLPLISLADSFYGCSNFDGGGSLWPGGYFGSRRTLKKKYGPNYFPYQELKEELGLLENVNKEICK